MNKNEEIKSIEYYLSKSSLSNNEERSEKEEKEKEKEEEKVSQIKNKSITSEMFTFLKKFICSFFQFLALTVLLMLIAILGLLFAADAKKYFWWILWTFISSSSITYTYVNFFIVGIENSFVNRLYLDGVFFIISSLLVFSYIKTNYGASTFNLEINQISLTLALLHEDSPVYYRQDYENFTINWENEGELEGFDAFYFSRGQAHYENKIEIFNVFEKFDVIESMNLTQFGILVSIIFLKISGIFSYIYVHSSYSLSTTEILDMAIVVFVYIQISHSLLRVFGSYDLRRKEDYMRYLRQLIDFQRNDIDRIFQYKLDITDPQSLEAFDNARKTMLQKEKERIERLDYSYIGLIFYYIFVIIVCVSYYFDLYWLIHNGSSLIDPISVIMNTGNFFFISAFLMFRFQYGTEFNNTFQDLEITVDYILDSTCDLITMYDNYFLKQLEEGKVFYIYSLSGLLVKKIKTLSKHYIQEKRYYLGKIYEKHEKQALRKEMLLNMERALLKLKQSVATDYKVHKYLFMGFVEVDFNSFLFTLLLGILTTLPTIVPKFIKFYQQE